MFSYSFHTISSSYLPLMQRLSLNLLTVTSGARRGGCNLVDISERAVFIFSNLSRMRDSSWRKLRSLVFLLKSKVRLFITFWNYFYIDSRRDFSCYYSMPLPYSQVYQSWVCSGKGSSLAQMECTRFIDSRLVCSKGFSSSISSAKSILSSGSFFTILQTKSEKGYEQRSFILTNLLVSSLQFILMALWQELYSKIFQLQSSRHMESASSPTQKISAFSWLQSGSAILFLRLRRYQGQRQLRIPSSQMPLLSFAYINSKAISQLLCLEKTSLSTSTNLPSSSTMTCCGLSAACGTSK